MTQLSKMEIFSRIAIIMITKVAIMLKRCLTKGNYTKCIMKGHGKGELINNTNFKINVIIVWCYGMIMGNVLINNRARSLWYYMQNPHTPHNDISNWLVHSCIHRLVKTKK